MLKFQSISNLTAACPIGGAPEIEQFTVEIGLHNHMEKIVFEAEIAEGTADTCGFWIRKY